MLFDQAFDVANRSDSPLVPVAIPVLIVLPRTLHAGVEIWLQSCYLMLKALFGVLIEIFVELVSCFYKLAGCGRIFGFDTRFWGDVPWHVAFAGPTECIAEKLHGLIESLSKPDYGEVFVEIVFC